MTDISETSLDSFFENVDQILSSQKFKGCTYPVFRGHSKYSYKLLPTLHRDYAKSGRTLETLENVLYCDFRSLAGPRVHFSDSWETLFAMRHEGVPTRLLDWTENLGTAIFFALDSLEIDAPHIWILNPFELNKVAFGRDVLVSPEEDYEAEYGMHYANLCDDSTRIKHELPLVIYPKRANDRLFAQRGLFTIHGSSYKSLEDQCPQCIEKLELPIGLLPRLRKLLFNFGINKYSVYPDFKGLSEYLKIYHKY